MMPTLLEVAERALEAVPSEVDGAQATASAERSLTLRFARSRPTQATSIDDVSVLVTVVRDGHVASAGTNRAGPDAVAACAVAGGDVAGAAARVCGPCVSPGPPTPPPLSS
ncbi:MAG: PmbA/TldA family metallopeptidase, partial [Thermoleophilaceae bacterium]